MTLRFFDRSASRIPKELGLIGVSHFRVAQSAVKFHSKSLFSDAVEGWNIVITEEPHQAEQQKPVLFSSFAKTLQGLGALFQILCIPMTWQT